MRRVLSLAVLAVAVVVSGWMSVAVTAQPQTPLLPSGASTAANQTTIAGHVDGIEGLLATIDSALSVLDDAAGELADEYITVRLSNGSDFLTPGTDYTHNAALTADSTSGPVGLFIAKDFDGSALPNPAGTENDAVLGTASLSGVQYMMLVSEDGSLQYGTSTTPLVVGDGSGSLNVIVDSGTVTTVSTLTTLSQFGGNAINLGAGNVGTGTLRTTLAADDPLVARRAGDPCFYGTKLVVAIDQTSGEQLFTGTASNRTYVCQINIVTATAQNIALVSGTGTVCATSLGPMAGGTTAATGWNFAANGGIALGDGSATVAKSDTDADNICLLQSSSGQVSGSITYVVAAN
jgi:hypothetical protein